MRKHYEIDKSSFSANAYRVKGHPGIAWRVLGWETQPDEDTEWTGYEQRTGQIVVVMVGDDRKFTVSPDEITPLEEEEFCGCCGQINCPWG